jgi:hypothetical protein
VNIADSSAARAKIAGETVGLTARIARLRAERAAVTETRSPAEIEASVKALSIKYALA